MESSVRVGNENKKRGGKHYTASTNYCTSFYKILPAVITWQKKFCLTRSKIFFIIIQNKGIFCVQQRFVRKYNKGHDLSEGFLYTILAACAMLLSVIFQTGFLQKWGNITKQHTFWGHTFLHNFTLLTFFHLENLTPYD